MTDNWDFYALRVDDEPASIFVDLGVRGRAPVPALPYMAYVRLSMNQPRPDGLSSREEFDTLIQIEKALEAHVCGDEVGYVGRNTSGGCRDFCFYTSSPDAWPGKVGRALAPFTDYTYETGVREDSEWTTYFDFLLPGETDLERIKNRRVCELLEKNGDKLVTEREIDHWSYFPSESAADAYLVEVKASGYQLRCKTVREESTLRYGAQVWRVDVPSYENIDGVALPLLDAATRHGGEYDGWECPVES